MNIFRFAFLAGVVMLAGCARVTTTTSLHADGSFSRKVVYTITKGQFNMPGSGGDSQQKKEKPDDYFKLPAAGSSIKVARNDTDTAQVVTVTRDIAAGSAQLDDIALLGDKGKVMATSSVTVTKLANGNLEYIETLHSTTPGKSIEQMVIPDLRARVKKALPEEFQKTELIDGLTREVMINLAHALVGPPEPNIFNLLMSTDSTARRINGLAFTANVKSFKAGIPALTDAQARQMAKSLANVLNQDMMNPASGGAQGPGGKGNSDNNAMTPLFFSVSFPGKVVETDGIYDPVEGDVYWSLLPMALDLGDVKLRVVVEP